MSARRAFISAWMMTREVIQKFGRDNGLFLASGLAFSLLLYVIPLALLMISILGYTVLESEQAMEEVQSVIRQFLPRSEQAFAEHVGAIVADRGLLGLVGFISFLLFSTMVFGSIRHVLNIVFQAGPARSLLRGTAQDLLMMVFCVALLIVAIGLASVETIIGNLGEHVPWAGALWGQGMQVLHQVMAVILGGSLILGLYRFSPVTTLKLGSLVVGAGVAVALFGLIRQGFAWYVHFAQGSIPLYGALGAFLFFFLWLYYASVVFVLGAEAAWAFDQAAVVPGKIHPVLSHRGEKGCERND
ncbi:MAG TPA: YihY/virulence factor BrkB family protein, partial [Nitrospira sp.]|nr:YihY/virulence factor BrkB family protein [Nitrospira sp.]